MPTKKLLLRIARELGPVDKFHPDLDGSEMEHTKKALRGFVVARGNGPIGLEMTDIALDPAALAVERLAPADRPRAVCLRRNDGADAPSLQIATDRVGVVGLVAEQRFRLRRGQIDQDCVGRAVRRLAAGEMEGDRPAAGVSETMNLTGEPAPRAAKRLFASPPFAPAACGWPRTIVLSMLWRSFSAIVSAKEVAAASQMPDRLQRRKHRQMLFHLPYRSGTSRHGAPVRSRHRMPLTVARRSSGGRPRRLFTAGRIASNTPHSASLRSPRLKAASPESAVLNQSARHASNFLSTGPSTVGHLDRTLPIASSKLLK